MLRAVATAPGIGQPRGARGRIRDRPHLDQSHGASPLNRVHAHPLRPWGHQWAGQQQATPQIQQSSSCHITQVRVHILSPLGQQWAGQQQAAPQIQQSSSCHITQVRVRTLSLLGQQWVWQ